MNVPLVFGPLLAGTRPPQSFGPYLNRVPSCRNHCTTTVRRPSMTDRLASRARTMLGAWQLHLRCARKILVGTRVTLDSIPSDLRNKCEYITYSGVEHQKFVPAATRRSSGQITLLYVGRLVAYKGLELLLRAVALARNTCRIRLQVVGTG